MLKNQRTLSPSDAAGITRGQAAKVVEMAEHGLVKSAVFRKIPTVQVDEFVKTVGPELRDLFVSMVENRFEAFTGRYIIPVNYDEQDAIANAIEENNFGYKHLSVKAKNIPIIGTGQYDQEVYEVHFGKCIHNRDLPDALKLRGQELGFKFGFKFCDVLTALKSARKFRDKQLEYPIAILFYDEDGKLCYLYLFRYNDERQLRTDHSHPDNYWVESVRFLVVDALVPSVLFS